MNSESIPVSGFVWRPRDRKTSLLTLLLAVLAVMFLITCIDVDRHFFHGDPHGDFFAIWSWAKIAIGHSAIGLYSRQVVHEGQVLLGMPASKEYPYAYPPTFLIFIRPLGFLRFMPAYLIWIGATFTAYVVASSRGVGLIRPVLYALVLAPTTALCLAVGQSGFLLAALLVGGARLARSRPVLAGILFGLLTYKPQFGLLVPLALLASRRWLCIASAAATFCVLVLVTALAFGTAAWPSWLHALTSFGAFFYASSNFDTVIVRMPTVLANLRTLGFAGDSAWALQLVAGLFAAAAVWLAWRRWPDGLAVPVLLAATYLTTPYGFLYDLPALGTAVILFGAWRLQGRGYLTMIELAVMVLVLAIPVYTNLPQAIVPVGSVPIIAFLALLLVTGFRAARSATPPAQPVAT